MKIRIRPIRSKDIKELAAVYSQVYKKFDVGERWTPRTAEKLLAFWLKKQPDLALVAEVDERLVGAYVAGIKPWWDGNHLTDGEIFVHPDYQKRGIGTKLSIALYEKALKKYQAVSFDFYTFKKKKFPLSWYLEQGFKKNEDWILISGKLKKVLTRLKKK